MAKILFLLTTGLGWKIIGDRLDDALRASSHAGPDLMRYKASPIVRRFTWHTGYHTDTPRHLPIIDPFTANLIQFRLGGYNFDKYDAIVAATQAQAAPLLFRRGGPPVFVLIDSTRHLYKTAFGSTHISERAIMLERKLFDRAHHVISLSNWAAQDVIGHYGLPEKKVSVFPPIAQSADKVTRVWDDSAPLKVLFLGGDFIRKGGLDLLNWQQERLHHFVQLFIVTDPKYERPNVPNTVWLGAVPNERVVSELLSEMDVLCHPTHRDCSAIVVAEAAMAGIPSVATNVGGVPELIDCGITGYTLEPGDGPGFINRLMRLSNDRALLKKLGAAARRKALATFEPTQAYEGLVRLVESRI